MNWHGPQNNDCGCCECTNLVPINDAGTGVTGTGTNVEGFEFIDEFNSLTWKSPSNLITGIGDSLVNAPITNSGILKVISNKTAIVGVGAFLGQRTLGKCFKIPPTVSLEEYKIRVGLSGIKQHGYTRRGIEGRQQYGRGNISIFLFNGPLSKLPNPVSAGSHEIAFLGMEANGGQEVAPTPEFLDTDQIPYWEKRHSFSGRLGSFNDTSIDPQSIEYVPVTEFWETGYSIELSLIPTGNYANKGTSSATYEYIFQSRFNGELLTGFQPNDYRAISDVENSRFITVGVRIGTGIVDISPVGNFAPNSDTGKLLYSGMTVDPKSPDTYQSWTYIDKFRIAFEKT